MFLGKIIARKIKREARSFTRELLGSEINLNDVMSVAKQLSNKEGNVAEPKSVSGATNIYIKQIERDFPDFHPAEAEAALRTFLTEYLNIAYNKQSDFINANVDKDMLHMAKADGQSKSISGIKINKAAISGYKKTSDYHGFEIWKNFHC